MIHTKKIIAIGVAILLVPSLALASGKKSNDIVQLEVTDGRSDAAVGEVVTYKMNVTNVNSEQSDFATTAEVDLSRGQVTGVSDHGKSTKTGDKTNIQWYVTFPYKKVKTLTFTVKVPDKKTDDQFCATGQVWAQHHGNLEILTADDCTKINNKKVPVVAAPKPPQDLKIGNAEFKLLTPDSLNLDPNDQAITWTASTRVMKAYPNVKLELCPGKDFKGCIVLKGSADNDGTQLINMPPVPRTGKWYLHMIGRDYNGNLRPTISAAKLITLSK